MISHPNTREDTHFDNAHLIRIKKQLGFHHLLTIKTDTVSTIYPEAITSMSRHDGQLISLFY